jgi:hypothetical protein
MQKFSKASFRVAFDDETPTDNNPARLYFSGPRIFLSDKTIFSTGNKLFLINFSKCAGKL